jgi:hypothetical protein
MKETDNLPKNRGLETNLTMGQVQNIGHGDITNNGQKLEIRCPITME